MYGVCLLSDGIGVIFTVAAAGELGLTDPGFHFLLRDTYNQLWLLIRQYITSAEKRSGACCLCDEPWSHNVLALPLVHTVKSRWT